MFVLVFPAYWLPSLFGGFRAWQHVADWPAGFKAALTPDAIVTISDNSLWMFTIPTIFFWCSTNRGQRAAERGMQ